MATRLAIFCTERLPRTTPVILTTLLFCYLCVCTYVRTTLAGEPHFSEVIKPGRRVYFTFGLSLRAVGTRHIKDGAHVGSVGDTYSGCMTGSDYEDKFSMSIHFKLWLQIKSV